MNSFDKAELRKAMMLSGFDSQEWTAMYVETKMDELKERYEIEKASKSWLQRLLGL